MHAPTRNYSRFPQTAVSLALMSAVLLNFVELDIRRRIMVSKAELDRLRRNLSRRNLDRLTERLFEYQTFAHETRYGLNLEHDLLELPDTLWEDEDLCALFRAAQATFDMPQRLEKLNHRISWELEALQSHSEYVRHKHSSRLEKIIIAVITLELALALLQTKTVTQHITHAAVSRAAEADAAPDEPRAVPRLARRRRVGVRGRAAVRVGAAEGQQRLQLLGQVVQAARSHRDDAGVALGGQDLAREVVEVPGGKPDEVDGHGGPHDEVEEHDGEGQLVGLDGENVDGHRAPHVPLRPVVYNREEERVVEHREAVGPVEHQADDGDQDHLDEHKVQVRPDGVGEHRVALEQRRELRAHVRLHDPAEGEGPRVEAPEQQPVELVLLPDQVPVQHQRLRRDDLEGREHREREHGGQQRARDARKPRVPGLRSVPVHPCPALAMKNAQAPQSATASTTGRGWLRRRSVRAVGR
ncbi:uncharacterized protein BcabD6B2_06770 [Babesia caballi]|uniref:DUF155 domain-containing protein n=1 Tax=Babesia caballi TaxID=5871 RepID=A0AAV4LNQ7_BABCB|nr:hypothetical protein BcabD6B2_06770 [Babesia caballi]